MLVINYFLYWFNVSSIKTRDDRKKVALVFCTDLIDSK